MYKIISQGSAFKTTDMQAMHFEQLNVSAAEVSEYAYSKWNILQFTKLFKKL